MFIAHLRQPSGCDYTIGCGHHIEKLKATTRAEALDEVKLLVIGKYLPKRNCFEEGYRGEQKLSSVTLYEISSEEQLPINDWYQDAEDLVAAGVEKKKEINDLKEFERLQNKFKK